ncbi:hypothetical protein ES288_D11G340600v1 [Gossypium darwinii]|uniref:TRAPPC10/Trs130 N-terminal domain-containing protein n=1 Tax=Gossypium darwinii TaxID=34276 RepID=A0A5D2AU54_GOSDA|nr:hypothetical protein ES288_D11G340600v1 [Gossypium darwinii]
MAKKVYAKFEADFSSKKRERCCKFDIYGPEPNFWEELEFRIMDSIKNTLDRRIQFYEDEIRKLSEQRFMPIWNFCNFFILKVWSSSESNAVMADIDPGINFMVFHSFVLPQLHFYLKHIS